MMPKARVAELTDVRQTAFNMYRIAYAWKDDMAAYASMSMQELFDLLKNIPFNADPNDTELLQRPFYTLNQAGRGGDCDDKAICVGAWCHLNGFPFRFLAVSMEPGADLHHVLTEIFYRGRWIEFDPTYNFNVLGRPLKQYTKRLYLRA
jgi:transglutaminase-like putative cysteine protease